MEEKCETGTAKVVQDWLGRLEVGEGKADDRMTLFPVFGGQAAEGLSYRTLAEAMAEGWAEVSERAAASVPELVLANRGKVMLFVLAGEEIVGGKQNRIVNASFLVDAGARVTLPVTCVERGRWHGTSPHFAPGEASYLSLRRAQQSQVRASLEMCSRPAADQGATWQELDTRHLAAGSRSATGAMHDLYSLREDQLAACERAFPYVERAIGLIVAVNGHVAGADLFDQSRTAAALWHRLLRSYALDALEGEPATPVEHSRAVRLLERARGARAETFPSLALGEDVRLEGEGVAGAALVYQGTPVHVSLFRIHGPARKGDDPHLARASLRRSLQERRPA